MGRGGIRVIYIILILVFATMVLLVLGLYHVVFHGRLATLNRLDETNRLLEPELYMHEIQQESQRGTGILPLIAKIFRRGKYLEKIRVRLLQAYIKMKPEEFIAVSITTGSVIGMLLYLQGSTLMLFMLGFLIGYPIPGVIVNNIKKKRGRLLNKQLPQALSIISNGLRAGFSFTQAMSVACQELEVPISYEFSKVLRDNSLGKPMEEALENLTKRTEDEDLDMLVTALLIQRQVGGNLAEVLDTISETIRERVKLKGEINTLTSQGKAEATIIGILPIGVAGIIGMLNPDYLRPLFTTTFGLVMVGVAGVLMGLGVYILSRLVQVKV